MLINDFKKALIKIHYQCNDNCVFCHAQDKRNSYSLNFYQIVKRIIKAKKLGAGMILFSGGEPTIHPSFLRIVDFLFADKVPFGLITNGRLLSYKHISQTLLKKGLKYAYISLYSFNKKKHDLIARTKGSFEQTIEGLKNLSFYSQNIVIIVNVVVTKFNIDDLRGIIDFLKKFKISKLKFSLVEPKGAALKNFGKVVPDLKEAARRINEAMDYGAKNKLSVFYDNLPFCLMKKEFREKKDDLKTNSIFWISEVFEDKFYPPDEGYQKKIKKCKGCSYFKRCPGIFVEYARRKGFKEINPVKIKKK